MVWLHTKKLVVVLAGALLNAVGMNLFLIPADVYASGFAGASQLYFSNCDGIYVIYDFDWYFTFIIKYSRGDFRLENDRQNVYTI